jgi:hypothetical protein
MAWRSLVVAHRGFGEFIVNEDIISGACKCPACDQQFSMHQIVLFLCKATARLLSQSESSSEYVADKPDEFLIVGSTTHQHSLPSDALLILTSRKLTTGCIVA